jgi:Lon protease-like protein
MSTTSNTLTQLPLFPLQSVLFPGGSLPMRIFEVRYLDMIGRCQKAGDPFGVVCLSEGSEVRRRSSEPGEGATTPGDGFAHEAFFPVGTLARITKFERPQPGLMMIDCVGTQRFQIQRSEQLKHGLWLADVELLADDALVPVPEDLHFTREALQALVRNIEKSAAESSEAGFEMPLLQPYRWDDCAWLANRWCEMLPLKPELKHRFMALDSPVLRLELVADMLGQIGFKLPD